MKTLAEIIELTRNGGKPEYDELRYALCALDHLNTFDSLVFEKLAQGESRGKKPFLIYSSVWQRNERRDRVSRAMNKAPDEYIGWDNNPDNPEFLKRREISIGIVKR